MERERVGNRLPIKKRISLSENEDSPKAAKRAKIPMAEWVEFEPVKMKQYQAATLSTHAPQLSPLTNRGNKDVTKSYCWNFVTPDSFVRDSSALFAMAPYPPFQRRISNLDLVRNEEVTNKKGYALDLLSSVSVLVAQTSGRSSQGNLKSHQSILGQDTAPEEMYRGQRHPETDLRQGKGMMKYLNGCQYVGFFVNDKREGYGKCYYPNGSIYTGYWKDGKRHGRGEIRYANGDRFDGEWKEDLRHGAGIYYWKDGTTDLCWYERQKIVGEGCRWSPDKEKMWALNNGEIVMLGPSTLQFHSEFGRVISRRLGF